MRRSWGKKPSGLATAVVDGHITAEEYAKLSQQPKQSKYKAVKTVVDGLQFDSKKEAARYVELKQLRDAGLIFDLELQKVIRCEVNGQLVCKYKADFAYFDMTEQRHIIEDVKGFKTDVYRLKKKLVKACTGIDITEL